MTRPNKRYGADWKKGDPKTCKHDFGVELLPDGRSRCMLCGALLPKVEYKGFTKADIDKIMLAIDRQEKLAKPTKELYKRVLVNMTHSGKRLGEALAEERITAATRKQLKAIAEKYPDLVIGPNMTLGEFDKVLDEVKGK